CLAPWLTGYGEPGATPHLSQGGTPLPDAALPGRAGYSVLQPLAKALPARGLEVRARGNDLFRVALAGPDRQSILEASNGSLAVLRPVAGKALTVSHAELHVSGSPPFWVRFAGPDRQGVLEGGDRPLLVLRPVAGNTLPAGNADIHAS